ncbi:MAG TPA: TlpA disulfide reductase family protein [Caldimonas sp.]|nr:TlpA disulfide reductase family protein [Caldimonas sp.]
MQSNRRAPALRAARRAALLRAAAAGIAVSLPWRIAAAGHVVRAWPAGRPAPPLDVVDLAGTPWRLEPLVGQVVVLNFWATWCAPCRLEMPSLDAMAARRRKDGVVVAAVNYKERPDVIRRFLEGAPFRSPILLDADGDATVSWTPRVFPSTVLIGRNGVPVHVVVGELDWEGAEARALVDPLVAASGRA